MSIDYAAVAEATWPAAHSLRVGPWTIRAGEGGGKRVSAATLDGPMGSIAQAERAMADLGQDALFMLRDGDASLDAALGAGGYQVVDPVWVYTIPVAQLADPLPHATAMQVWPPLAIQRELWAEGGIGPARLAVMDRAPGPKTSVLGRAKDQPAGSAFVAIHQNCAMIHAIEITPALRRLGVARNILRCAANWAQDQGAAELSLLVTKANAGANALYTSLGMEIVGHYHYRKK